jgi:RHS repeat-associated protein
LTGETARNPSNTITFQASYSYDPVGNRTTMTKNGQATVYAYNALDQLVSAGGTQYSYDGRGNLIEVRNGGSTATFSYDAANRLASSTGPTGSATYAYDPDGRRVRQTTGGAVTNYLWDEQSAHGDVVLETNGAGATLASYVLGGRGSCSQCGDSAELISQTRGGTASYYLHDGQGNVRALADQNGIITDRYTYDAFGEVLNQQGTNLNPYRYAGQQLDGLTGLYSMRARYYSPTIGRFQSRDLVDAPLADPTELNRYTYARNNPATYTDPTGLQAMPIPMPRPIPIPQPRPLPRPTAGGNEYALLISLIAIALIPAVQALGEAIKCKFIYVATFLMGAANIPTSGLPFEIRCQFPVCEFPLVGNMPNVWGHMAIAIFLKGKPRLLTYDPDEARANIRRNLACGGVNARSPWSCDEYPFAHTWQGGAGSSTAVVLGTENSSQGGYFGACVRKFNLGSRPDKNFWVVLKPF